MKILATHALAQNILKTTLNDHGTVLFGEEVPRRRTWKEWLFRVTPSTYTKQVGPPISTPWSYTQNSVVNAEEIHLSEHLDKIKVFALGDSDGRLLTTWVSLPHRNLQRGDILLFAPGSIRFSINWS